MWTTHWSFVRVALVIGASLSSTIASSQTIQEQGAECVRELGNFPGLNCLEGTILEITADNKPLNHFDQHTKCDRPPLLEDVSDYGNQCVPYSRVRTQTTDNDDVVWTLLCRRYKVRDRDAAEFDDVALIGQRKSTGATCFFQALASDKGHTLDGAHVPAPTDGNADQFWMTPVQISQLTCFRCHDNDPWIHTPYIDQVADANKVRSNPWGKYRFVAFVNQPPENQWPAPNSFKLTGQGNHCVKCHRMGTGNSSDEFTRYSTKRLATPDVTDMFKAYPQSHWMPKPNDAPSEPEWNNKYNASVTQILACYNAPVTPLCVLSPIPQVVPGDAKGKPEVFQDPISGCEMMGYRLAFDEGVPYHSAAIEDEKCYCGARDGVSPEDARKAGWSARDAEGTCTCSFTKGQKGDNACRKS